MQKQNQPLLPTKQQKNHNQLMILKFRVSKGKDTAAKKQNTVHNRWNTLTTDWKLWRRILWH